MCMSAKQKQTNKQKQQQQQRRQQKQQHQQINKETKNGFIRHDTHFEKIACDPDVK